MEIVIFLGIPPPLAASTNFSRKVLKSILKFRHMFQIFRDFSDKFRGEDPDFLI